MHVGAVVAVGLCITTPTPVEAESTQVYGGKYREDVSREIVEKQWELVELRKAGAEIERKPDKQGATTELLATDSSGDASQATAPALSIEYPFNLRAEVAPIETVKPVELVASQPDEKAKKAALLRKRQDEEALLMILLNL
jgi:hypothetical protein